jgi:malectin (di-glucose binding ER protein)
MKKHLSRRRFLELSALTTAVAGGALEAFPAQNAQAALAATYTPPASSRIDTIIDTGWKFFEGDVSNAQAPTFDDSSWSAVTLPHTWNNIDGQKGGSYYRGISWYHFTYNLPLVNGTYTLYLHFAETYWSAAGKRVFSVSANGTTILSNLDIYSQAGKDAALQKQFTVSVSNGTLALNFTASVDNAIIGAIALVATS